MPSQDKPFDAAIASAFFSTLWPYGIPDNNFLSIWTLVDKTTYQFASFKHLYERLSDVQYGSDTYFGVGLSQRSTGRKNRPGKADISLIPALWLDLDAKHGVTMEQLTGYLKTTFPPTITVATGHGLQAYWCLTQPIDNITATRLCEGFTRFHQKRAPFPIDSLIDTSRVLRVPGTWNWKQPEEIVPCRLIDASGPRYDLSELLVFDVPEEHPPRPTLPDVLPESGGPYGGRDNTLFKFMSNCERFGLPESWTLSACHAINRQHFSPPLDDKLVDSKVKATYARYRGSRKAASTKTALTAQDAEKMASLHQELFND